MIEAAGSGMGRLKDAAIMLAACAFSKWVFSGKTYEMDYSLDPPWDHSGRLVETKTNSSGRLAMYDTLGDWMEDCFTGSSTASHESRCGLYHDRFYWEIQDAVQSLAEGLLIEEHGLDKTSDDVIEIVADDAVELWVEAMEAVEKIATAFAWEIARFGAVSETI